MPTRDEMNRAAAPMRLALPGPVIPTDPRDAEIARLRALVTELLGNVDDLTVELNEHREAARHSTLWANALLAEINAARASIADMRGQLQPHQRPAKKEYTCVYLHQPCSGKESVRCICR